MPQGVAVTLDPRRARQSMILPETCRHSCHKGLIWDSRRRRQPLSPHAHLQRKLQAQAICLLTLTLIFTSHRTPKRRLYRHTFEGLTESHALAEPTGKLAQEEKSPQTGAVLTSAASSQASASVISWSAECNACTTRLEE